MFVNIKPPFSKNFLFLNQGTSNAEYYSIIMQRLLPVFISILLVCSCSGNDQARVSGHIDYVGSSAIYIEKQPVHYKYASVKKIAVTADEEGRFDLTVPADSTEVVFITIDEDRYPVIIKPGAHIELTIQRAHFPDSVQVKGYAQHWDELYTKYRKADRQLRKAIDKELPEFREGKPSDVLELYKNRIMIAKRYFGDSPLDMYYHKTIGEYLVKRLEYIKYNRNNQKSDPEKERKAVIGLAKEMNFFTFTVLKSQRAGIRDFTNAYANTFGVEKKLEKQYGQDLIQYDVNRLGYETLDSARTSVLKHITDRRALAYSKMHLIAERIGEMSPEVAEPGYQAFLEKYEDFPEYTAFLKNFYQEVKSVSPGQPAVDFALPDRQNKTVRMKDFRGRYVLLDFWAAWCIPCLNEFSHMKELYEKYSRNDFEIAAISIEQDSLVWRKALHRFNNPWIQLYGGKGFDQTTFEFYRGGGIPFYILVNREGNIERYNDIRPSFNLEEVLDSLLANENKP